MSRSFSLPAGGKPSHGDFFRGDISLLSGPGSHGSKERCPPLSRRVCRAGDTRDMFSSSSSRVVVVVVVRGGGIPTAGQSTAILTRRNVVFAVLLLLFVVVGLHACHTNARAVAGRASAAAADEGGLFGATLRCLPPVVAGRTGRDCCCEGDGRTPSACLRDGHSRPL